MTVEEKIFRAIQRQAQGMEKCRKFIGDVTVETIRKYLRREGFNVSARNVYLRGVLNQIDLLILKKSVPRNKIHYEPEDIIAAFEIKYRGCYGTDSVLAINKLRNAVKAVNRKALFLYLTISEKKTYIHRLSRKNSEAEIFELFLTETSSNTGIENGIFPPTGDWKKLVKRIRQAR